VRQLCQDIQDGLAKYLQLPAGYLVVLGNGGATAVFDMIALGLVEKQISHDTCGAFSDRWYEASKRVPWIEAEKRVTASNSQEALPPRTGTPDVQAVTLNETSTGEMLRALPEVGAGTLLAVDATSGAGQIPLDYSRCDIVFFSPQKVFSSDGGLFVAILSPKAQERVTRIASMAGRYIPSFMDWRSAIENSRSNQTTNTPAIATLFLFAEQVNEMNTIGSEAIYELSRAKASLVYEWAERKDYLSPFIVDARSRSISVATIEVDPTFPVGPLVKLLEQRKQVYGIDGYAGIGRNQLRIGLFPNVSLDNLQCLMSLLSFYLENVTLN
jgi:phosphoserine aminotransferase